MINSIRYAGDIIKALKYSKALVPESLEKLWQDYKKEAEAVCDYKIHSHYLKHFHNSNEYYGHS